MDAQEKVKMLQTLYAGALADSVLRLGREGVLEKVTREKRSEQMAGGAVRAKQFGTTTIEEVFLKLADLMGCANWTVESTSDGCHATATRCMLCAMAKKMGAPQPCSIYCLDPMEGMAKGIEPGITFTTDSTLWDGEKCSVQIHRQEA